MKLNLSMVFCLWMVTGVMAAEIEILDHRTVTLPAPEAERAATFSLDLFGRDVELRLEDNHEPFAALDTAQRARIFTGGNRFLRGTVAGIENSWVRLSWIDGRWSGGIFDGRELFLLESAEHLAGMLARDVPAGALVLYRLSDLRLPELALAPPVMPGDASDIVGGSGAQREGMIQGAYEALPVTIVSDTQFTADHGGNTAAVVAGRINFVDGIYRSEVDVGIALHHHEILANNGTLTSTNANTLLADFKDYMNTGAGSGIPVAGVAHLFTGRDLVDNQGEDGVAGIAFQGVLCHPNSPYGIDETFSNEPLSGVLFAHELGHNFGAPHDNEADSVCENEPGGRIMNPSVNDTMSEFSNCSKQQMADDINTATCLVDTALFRDRFEQ